MNQPTLTTKVYLVEHGYQIDFLDENGESLGSECRDFGGEYPVENMRDLTIAGFLSIMPKLENKYPFAFPETKK